MYDINEIKYLYDRLKAQYPRYAADFSRECLTLTLLHGRVEVNRKGCLLFVNEKLYDELSSEEVDDADDLYELIEMFLIQMQRLGMESGNETYIAARDKAIQKGTRTLMSASILSFGCLIALLLTKNLICLVLFFLCPAAGYWRLRLIRQKAFRQYWVCPGCGQTLPIDKKSSFPQMEYVSQCPHCGKILEEAPEMDPVRLEPDAPKKQLDPDYHPPLPGRKWPCVLNGSISIVFSLFLFAVLFFSGEPLEPQNAAVTLLLLLIWCCFGVILLLCRHTEPEETQLPVVVLRERKTVTGVGIFLWLLGGIFLFMAIAVAVADPVDGFTIFLAAIGLLLMFVGVWMILAGRNRSMFVFQDHSILYISSWGRQKNMSRGK